MTVSFTSTYRVPFKPKSGKLSIGRIDELKKIAEAHGGIVPSGRATSVRFSVRKKFDEEIKKTLAKLGCNYDVVDKHNVPKTEIGDALDGLGRFDPKRSRAEKSFFANE